MAYALARFQRASGRVDSASHLDAHSLLTSFREAARVLRDEREKWEVRTIWEGRGMSISCFVPIVRQTLRTRNFVRARAKDATGKAQRNHFGKQRLGILTKGLSKARLEVLKSTDSAVADVASTISLAHAQRDLRTQPADTSLTVDNLGPHSNIYATPYTSRPWHTSDSSSSASGKSRSSRRSKILNALDMSVRMSLCAYMRPTLS